MNIEKTRVSVTIAGNDYVMTSYDGEAYIRRVAGYVDRRMNELSLATRLPSARLAVLTALNLADELFKARDENNRLRRDLGLAREALEAAGGASPAPGKAD